MATMPAPLAPLGASASDEPHIRGLRLHEYEILVNAGVFHGQKLELLHGQLVDVSPQGEPHVAAIVRLTRLLTKALKDEYWVRPQLQWGASNDSAPEPDIAVVCEADSLAAFPTHALLLIEVSASSLAFDRGVKRDLYAKAGVPEYWVVDVEAACVHIYRQPEDGAFTSVTRAERGDTLTPIAIADLTVEVDAIFGPRADG